MDTSIAGMNFSTAIQVGRGINSNIWTLIQSLDLFILKNVDSPKTKTNL